MFHVDKSLYIGIWRLVTITGHTNPSPCNIAIWAFLQVHTDFQKVFIPNQPKRGTPSPLVSFVLTQFCLQKFMHPFKWNSTGNLTNATKKRTTTSKDLIAGDCIQVFLTAMRSAKWLVAESIPIKSLTGVLGNGRAFHFVDISSTLWGEKLGWDVGREVA